MVGQSLVTLYRMSLMVSRPDTCNRYVLRLLEVQARGISSLRVCSKNPRRRGGPRYYEGTPLFHLRHMREYRNALDIVGSSGHTIEILGERSWVCSLLWPSGEPRVGVRHLHTRDYAWARPSHRLPDGRSVSRYNALLVR